MSTETTDHALEQAKSQASGIVEMVRALDRETAIEDFVSGIPDNKVQMLASDLSLIEPEDENPPLDALRERIEDGLKNETIDESEAGFEWDEDEARQTIQEDPLSVEMRSGWVSSKEDMEPEEFCILLCTGGPAVRIRGELDRGEPSRAWIEYQDWGTPWTQLFDGIERETLLTYCRQFYFGE